VEEVENPPQIFIKKKNMKVEIRPIDKNKWHGKKGSESFSRPHNIEALVDVKTMKYATGLSEEDIKLLKGKGCSYDLSDDFVNGKVHPFWESKMAQIKLENKTMFLNPDKTMLDFIKVKICKASKYVANSMQEFEEGKWPDATHIIHDESEQVEIKASKVAIKNQAVIEVSKLPLEKKIQLCMILGGKNVKGKSENHVEVAVSELLEENAEDVLNFIKLDADKMELHALVLECLQKNILVKKGHKIEYNGSSLGGDVYQVIDYLNESENNELRIRLTAAVN